MANSILSGITEGLLNQQGPLWSGLEEKRKREQQQKDEARELKLKALSQAISLPGISQEARDQIGKDIQGLLPPEAKKTHGKILQTIGGIFGAVKPKEGAQVSQPQVSGQAQLSQPNIFGDISKAYGQTQTPKDAITQRREASIKKLEEARARGASAEELSRLEDEDEFVETGKWPTKKGLSSGSLKQVGYKLPDGTQWRGVMDPKAKPGSEFFTLDGTPFQMPGGAEQLPNPANVRPVQQASDYLTKKQMMEVAQSKGTVFYDENLQPINLREIPDDPNIVMQGVNVGGGTNARKIYTPRNVNDNVISVGGMKIAVSPTELPTLGEAGPSSTRYLGAQSAGSTSTREQVGIDPSTGKAAATTLTATRTPNTPGLIAPSPGAARISSPQFRGGAATTNTLSPVLTPPVRGGTRELGNFLPTGIAGQQEKQIAGMRGLVTTAFGDPEFPNLKSLADYSYLADSKESREKIASTADLIRSVGFEGPNGDETGVKIGPIHASSGGLGDWLSYFVGVPKGVSKEKTRLIQSSIQKMNPQEKDALNIIMTMYADISAIRGLTGQAATEAAARTAQAEMANFMTTQSKQDFENMLKRTAALVNEGTAFNQFMKPGMRERLNKFMGGKAPGGSPLSTPGVSVPGDESLTKKLDKVFAPTR